MIVGAYIEGDTVCTECAQEELENHLTAIEAKHALSNYCSDRYDTWPLRYNGKITDISVWYDEKECEYVLVEYKNFRLSHAHLTFYDLDVKEASERFYDETELERLGVHDLIYVAKIDGVLTIVADSDFIGDNEEKATYIVRRNYWTEDEDNKIIRAIIEGNYRDGIYLLSDNDSHDDDDGTMCENGINCKNSNGGIYWIFEPYETTCGCSGCDSCIKGENDRSCTLTTATGKVAVIAEDGYSWRNQLCPDCQAQELLDIDEEVKTFVADLLHFYSWNNDNNNVRELERISTLLTQYGAYNGYEYIAAPLTVFDVCSGTARAKVVEKIEELCENAEIKLDEWLHCEWVDMLENDYNLVERVERQRWNEKAEKYNKRFCTCPVHANQR
jgi:hypothetical protein